MAETDEEWKQKHIHELSQWQQYSSYCKCCALSGESNLLNFKDFIGSLDENQQQRNSDG